jgi:hypothetical protein
VLLVIGGKGVLVKHHEFRLIRVQSGEIACIICDGTSSPWLFDIRDLDDWIERNKRTL